MAISFQADTIVAISTPPGRGGIGIVRLSGPEATRIVLPILQLTHPLQAGRIRLAKILEAASGDVLDEVIVTFYSAPHSYTTEDIVEIACHGAPVLLEAVLRACIEGGARIAEPGEFTQRAFLAGRLDLLQAEAVHDLVGATTLQQARVAAAQLGGALSKQVSPVKRLLIDLIAALEAGVDFAEDGLDIMPQTEIAERITEMQTPLAKLAATYRYGHVLREGFTLAIVGQPNAGKSSLFNCLLSRQRAIVTDQPGTTRDALTERMEIEGIPVELMDTAGLRTAPAGPEGEAERLGMEKSAAAIAEADLVLHVLDGGILAANGATQQEPLPTQPGGAYLVVLNKSDLLEREMNDTAAIRTSAHTGQGIEELKKAIVAELTQSGSQPESAVLTNVRQRRAIEQAIVALSEATEALKARIPHEMLLLNFYAALEALDSLTGATPSEEILEVIFTTFCIGK